MDNRTVLTSVHCTGHLPFALCHSNPYSHICTDNHTILTYVHSTGHRSVVESDPGVQYNTNLICHPIFNCLCVCSWNISYSISTFAYTASIHVCCTIPYGAYRFQCEWTRHPIFNSTHTCH